MTKILPFREGLGGRRKVSGDLCVPIEAHRRLYQFDYLEPLYGRPLAEQICALWPRVCLLQTYAVTQDRYMVLKMLLVCSQGLALEEPKSEVAEFVDWLQTRDLKSVPEELLQAAAVAFGNKLRDLQDFTLTKSNLLRTRAGFVYSLNGLLRRLAELDELPAINSVVAANWKNERATRRPSLGELSASGRAAVVCISGSLDDHVEGMLNLCEARLTALRRCLEVEFAAEWAAFEQGQQWLADDTLPTNDEVRRAAAGLYREYNSIAYAALLKQRLQEAYGATSEQHLALAVRWLHGELGGVLCMRGASHLTKALMRLAGGTDQVVRHLEANDAATNAAFGLILCDTGMNVAPASKLPAQPFISDAQRGKRRLATLASHKMRAEGKVVHAALMDEGEADLPLKSDRHEISSIVAIERYQKMVEPLRRRAIEQGSKDADLLFLSSAGATPNAGTIINAVACGFAGEIWPAFMSRQSHDETIGGLPITRAMIRTTVLLLRSGRNEFTTAPAQALAEHKRAGITGSYIDAPFMRKQLDEQIRFFTQLFESALTYGIDGAHELVGVDEETFRQRVLAAIDTGLDFACADRIPSAAALPNRPTCTPLNPCDECPVRRFVPNESNMLTLHLAHTALERAEAEFIGTNPRRWMKFWLPWRALTEAYVSKIRASQHARSYAQIEQLAARQVASGRLSLPIVR